jgi:hypothetical protein
VTGREFAKLAQKHLMPYLSGFALKDGYVYALPVDRLWRRFVLNPSGFSRESFTIGCAASPLYVPEAAHSYPIGLGDRLPVLAGQGDRWWTWQPGDEGSERAMMEDIRALMLDVGVPFLNQFPTPESVADTLIRHPSKADDPNLLEELAYSLILAGRLELAAEALDDLRRMTLKDEERATWWAELQSEENGPADEDWVITVGRRGDSVAQALRRSAADAVAILDAWNEEQLAELRLRRYA